MVSNLGVNGVSNANWQATPLRAQWMAQNNVAMLDISPFNGSVTLVGVSCGTITDGFNLLPQYLRPVT
jgi:hypothetical protein